MIDERIDKTKATIESAENIPADKKAELLDLLSKLKPAIAKVSHTHHDDAQSIARLVEASAHETIRGEIDDYRRGAPRRAGGERGGHGRTHNFAPHFQP